MSLLAESLLKQEKDANDVWFIDSICKHSKECSGNQPVML